MNGLVDSLTFAGVEIGERYSGNRIGLPRLSIRRCVSQSNNMDFKSEYCTIANGSNTVILVYAS